MNVCNLKDVMTCNCNYKINIVVALKKTKKKTLLHRKLTPLNISYLYNTNTSGLQ